jgi:lysophospholipid acyltransferase (LPLAT)-like uncharacterized protein
MGPMSPRLRNWLIDRLGRPVVWLWFKSARMRIEGEEHCRKLREARRGIIHIIWHGKIFIVPFFFRKRDIMPLVSPSQDGEIAARVMDGWGYKILRGSGSHFMKDAWLAMIEELRAGGEVIIIPDGPKGPDRKLKMGCVRLAAETGAAILPFSFTTDRKKVLKSWDRFLMFPPFSRVLAAYGEPIDVPPSLDPAGLERERERIEEVFVRFDAEVDKKLRDRL